MSVLKKLLGCADALIFLTMSYFFAELFLREHTRAYKTIYVVIYVLYVIVAISRLVVARKYREGD